MVDIRTITDPVELISNYLLLPDGQLDARYDLATAVTLSLFVDRRADETDTLPTPDSDRRGVWSDLDGEELYGIALQGSRLWLLSREVSRAELPVIAEFYIREALQWMIDDNAVSRFDITVTLAGGPSERCLFAEVTAVRDRQNDVKLRFQPLWQELAAA